MDAALIVWARAARARAHRSPHAKTLPTLWLFTDSRRLSDPRAAVARLPPGLAGVVLRHDTDPDRARLGRDLARICRARRLILVVSGDARLAASLHAGLHLRNGRRHGNVRLRTQPITSSAHAPTDLVRARRAGAALVFLSPVFATSSHPEARPLGPIRWAALSHRAGLPVAALGGLSGSIVHRLPRRCAAAGAIGALI